MKRIENISELLNFINTNYEKLSEKKYAEILLHTLDVYTLEKPKSKEKALKLIQEHYDFLASRPSHWEKPLFLKGE